MNEFIGLKRSIRWGGFQLKKKIRTTSTPLVRNKSKKSTEYPRNWLSKMNYWIDEVKKCLMNIKNNRSVSLITENWNAKQNSRNARHQQTILLIKNCVISYMNWLYCLALLLFRFNVSIQNDFNYHQNFEYTSMNIA